jgi:dienelactone hydrolase
MVAGAVAIAAVTGGVYAAAMAATSAAPGHPGRAGAGRHSPSSRPSPRHPPPRRLPFGTIGGYPVTGRSFVLADHSRASTAGIRVLPTFVRYPVIPASAAAHGPLARGLFPLLVFAPGFVQCGNSYAALLNAWASAGYVVAAVEFPRTNCHVSHPDEADLVNQPGDVSFVIGRLTAMSGQRHGVLSGLINPAQVAVAGQSDGGDTVAAVAASTCCADHRVKAALVLSGAEWPPLGGSWFPAGTPPIMFVQGDADTINPPAASLRMYRADRAGPRFYLDLFGAGHLPPYEGDQPPEPVVARVTTAFLDRYVAGQLPAAAVMTRAGHVAGLADLVRGGRLPP